MTTTNAKVAVQYAVEAPVLPSEKEICHWVNTVLQGFPEKQQAEVLVRLVDKDEMQRLNESYRNKPGPTNVLAFPFEVPELDTMQEILGDIVICAEVIAAEAAAQHKPEMAHWTHMVIHGLLHLLGYDHVEVTEASQMEQLEVYYLEALGVANPY